MSEFSNGINFRSFGPVYNEIWPNEWTMFIWSKFWVYILVIQIRSDFKSLFRQNFGMVSPWKLVHFRYSLTPNGLIPIRVTHFLLWLKTYTAINKHSTWKEITLPIFISPSPKLQICIHGTSIIIKHLNTINFQPFRQVFNSQFKTLVQLVKINTTHTKTIC